MNNIDQFERIEAYINGTLSPAQQSQFQEELRNDKTLREAHEQLLMVHDVKGALVYSVAKKRLQENKTIRLEAWHRRTGIRIAAAIALLVIGIMTYANLRYSDLRIVATHLALPDEVNMRSIDDGQPYLSAVASFSSGNYADVIRIVETSEIEPRYTLLAQKMYAVSLLRSGFSKKAIEVFSTLAANERNMTRSREHFNLAIAYLQDGQLDQAENVLMSITSDQEHEYREDAIQLLRKIKSPLRKLVF